jgi:hypothetical protein
MDPASSADDRLREIIDHLLTSPFVNEADHALVEEAKAILCAPRRAAVVTVRRDPRTVPEPTVASPRVGGGR